MFFPSQIKNKDKKTDKKSKGKKQIWWKSLVHFMTPPVNAENKQELASPRQRKMLKIWVTPSACLVDCRLTDSLACQKIKWQTLSALTCVLMNHFQSLSKRKNYSNVLSGLLSFCHDYSMCSVLWNSIKITLTLNLILCCILHERETHLILPSAALHRLFYPKIRQIISGDHLIFSEL